MQHLPTVLAREPLVDAIFEVRLNTVNNTPSLADILPGALFSRLNDKPTIHRLPTADIPQPMRAGDPNLRFAPIVRLDFQRHSVSVGDHSFFISCKLPYPKWPAFKEAILEITGQIAASGVHGRVDRYSLKYVNIIEAQSIEDQINKINLSISLGHIDVNNEYFNLQVHRTEGDIIHIMTVVSGAQAKLYDGRLVSGIVVDIDSIRNVNFTDFPSFVSSLAQGVEELRQSNKVRFFDCLTDGAIDEMGPSYE